MASSSSRQGHLDASAGRDVVYCHQCENEWYQDEHGLQCPRCSSEATEIIAPDNDPREFHHEEQPSPPGFGSRHSSPFHHHMPASMPASDSDPEEADIDQLRQGPGGFTMRRVIYRSPNSGGAGGAGGAPRGADDQGRTDPADGDAILRRFTDMLMRDFNVGSPGRSGPDTLFPPAGGEEGPSAPRHIHTTTFTAPGFSGGTATFTIATGPIFRSRGGPSPPPPPGMDFDTVFGNIMGNLRPPDPSDPDGASRAGPLPGFAVGLQQILASLLNPAAAVHGDAVYTQEALDRIITTLMEANPQSNAAPPATQSAIDGLERRKLDGQMLGSDPKAECTICIDDINLGDEVTILPCKHWFHGECVVLWLKEHNTCPICRHPVEGGDNRGANAAAGANPAANLDPAARPPQAPAPAPPASASAPQATATGASPPSFASNNPYRRRDRLVRTPSENEERLNAIRSAAGGPEGRGSPRSRRDSYSPPRPGGLHHSHSDSSARERARASPYADWRSGLADRERDRAPPQSEPPSRDGGGGGGGGSSGSHNPLSWLRDQFSRGSGGGSGGGSRRS